MINKSDITNVLEAILAGARSENAAEAEKVSSNSSVQAALECLRCGDLDGFYFGLMYPIESVIDGLLSRELNSPRAEFLAKNLTFVEQNFQKLIVRYEGSPCCADKSRTIMRSLLKFFATGEEISFDRTQKYTYHLPKYIFTTHSEIFEFFESLRGLYYGDSQDYLRVILSIHKRGMAAQEDRLRSDSVETPTDDAAPEQVKLEK